jgi:hypothetical protein
VKPVPLTLTKPTIVSAHSASTNGHASSTAEKRPLSSTSLPINGHHAQPSIANGHGSDQNGHHVVSNLEEPAKKKQRMEERSLSISSSASGDHSTASSILSKKHQKKKAKKAAHDLSAMHQNGISSHSSISVSNGNIFQGKKLPLLSSRELL